MATTARPVRPIVTRKCACSATCTQRTRRTFAQGHDARLVSQLVKQVMATELDEVVAAQRVIAAGGTSALVNKLQTAVANASAKKARTTAPAAPAAPEPKVISAKVGRWTYQGVLNGPELFEYTDRQGDARVTAKFTLV